MAATADDETARAEPGPGGGRRVPLVATLLGGFGLAPPAIAILVRLTAAETDNTPLAHFAMVVGLQYVLLILSFLGGAWWGAAAAGAAPGTLGRRLFVAVLPSLVALGLYTLSNWSPGPSAVLLAVAVAATLVVDRGLMRDRLVPRWWMRLRVPLSLLLAAETLVLASLL